jgi:UDP-N-acetylmuramate dehydrogenase
MPLTIHENVPLAPLTTFRVGGPARFFIEAVTENEVRAAVEHAVLNNLKLFVLGGGSNLVIADSGWPGLVLKIALQGISEHREGKNVYVTAAAGEDWDSFVAYCVELGYAGIECLSGIPGSVGGTPVQNVGAYGQEVAETISTIRVFDLAAGQVRDISNADAGFTYRTSVFNSSQRGRFIVLAVTFQLIPGGAPTIEYADLKKYFAERNLAAPTLRQVREAVRAVRHSKAMLIVPDDPDCRSAGSFFKNPIVSEAEYQHIAARAPEAPPRYPAADGRVKISAAWLVERAGFHKGYSRGPVGLSSKHALAIVNRGGATAADILALRDQIQGRVAEVFGVQLHPEPVFVGLDASSANRTAASPPQV